MLDNEPQDRLGDQGGDRDEAVTSPGNTAQTPAETAAPVRRTRAPRRKATAAAAAPCAIIDLVVRHVTPAVRPDDVLSGLRVVAGLEPPVPPRATRLAQGRLVQDTLTPQGEIVDPLDADREDATIGGR